MIDAAENLIIQALMDSSELVFGGKRLRGSSKKLVERLGVNVR
jgi:hypothetical protein